MKKEKNSYMHRIQSSHSLFICSFFLFFLLYSTQVFAGNKESFLKKQFTTHNGYKLNYRILYPVDYSADKQYPVILFLHGAGERGSDNESQLVHGGNMFASYENRTNFPAIVIAPQCPEDSYWINHLRPEGETKRVFPYAPPVTQSLAAVKELVDSYIDRGIVDTQKIHVIGLSMGGMGTFDLVCRYPDYFATATPICGGVNTERLAHYKGKTWFRIYHGADDSVVDVQFSRDAYETLKKIGAKVTYKEYPGVNHNSWDNAFAEPDFISWMFAPHL